MRQIFVQPYLASRSSYRGVQTFRRCRKSCRSDFKNCNRFGFRFFFVDESKVGYVWAGTDLRIGQIGYGLGPRPFGGPAQRSFLWRLNVN